MDEFDKEVAKIHRKHLVKRIWDAVIVCCIIFIIYELLIK